MWKCKKMGIIDRDKSSVEVKFGERSAEFFTSDKKIGTISFKSNPYHAQHCYLELDFENYDLMNVKLIFDILATKIKKPLQAMISSDAKDTIAFLKEAGFVCKRKCYEIEAQKKDYIGREKEAQLFVAQSGESIYEKCCAMMLDRYISTHNAISPWTGTTTDFYNNLPDRVLYCMRNGEVESFAFVDENEIAYVCGIDVKAFHAFAESLLIKMFKEYESIIFEADDCDEYAMELKALFINQSNGSFDTYIL